MVDRPAPMSPPECDLRGYEYMPLFGHRLFNSDFNDMANAEEFRAAMKLWWAAWQQCPAGSLPNNDTALARLSDFGRDLEGWLKIKKVALHGFIECNDERIYHPLICNEAQIAFAHRRRDKERKAAQRAAKKRLSGMGQSAGHPNGHPNGHPQDIQGMSLAASAGCPMGQDMGHPLDVRSDRTGQDRTSQPRGRAALGVAYCGYETKPDSETGEPCINGFRLNGVTGDGLEAAGLDCARLSANVRVVASWLHDGFDANKIPDIIGKVAARPNYPGADSLAYFDKAIREQCPKDPLFQRH